MNSVSTKKIRQTFTLPEAVFRRFASVVPEGQRSALVSELLENEARRREESLRNACLAANDSATLADVEADFQALEDTVSEPFEPMEATRKATFVLPEAMLLEMRELVQTGYAASASSLVRESLAHRIRELREESLRRQFSQAARDPEFMRDLTEVMRDFEPLDVESARLIPP